MAFSLKESSSCSLIESTDRFEIVSERVDNKTLYKTDKKCVVCKNFFGFFVTTYRKKYWCKFCYQGVCASCSPQRVPHPESMRIVRICNSCYQNVMTEHFKKEIDLDIYNLKKQKEEFNFLLSQEIKRRATKTAKKKILEGILSELEKESEGKDRESRIKISKLRAKKEIIVGKMNTTLKKFHETQREREKKEKMIKELEIEAEGIKNNINGSDDLWNTMKELREKKMKLSKKYELSNNSTKSVETENYEGLLETYKEVAEENRKLLEELSQLTADLEIKELKIRNLQKKIAEMTAVFQCESDTDTESKEVKFKISQQQEIIHDLRQKLDTEEKKLDEITSKTCKCEII